MIYPVPQKNNLNGEKIVVKSVALSGDCVEIANKVFGSFGIEANGGFKVEIKISDSKKTTDDLNFTVETVACLGACGLAPAMTVNDKVYPSMTPEKAVALLKELKETL